MLAAWTVASTVEFSMVSPMVIVARKVSEITANLRRHEVASDEVNVGVHGVDGVDAGSGKSCSCGSPSFRALCVLSRIIVAYCNYLSSSNLISNYLCMMGGDDSHQCVSLGGREGSPFWAAARDERAHVEGNWRELEAKCQLPLAWFDVLLQLRKSDDGRLKMSQIADAIVHSTGGTTRLIDRLEEAGLVRREHCANDRRAIYVAITDAGSAKLDEALLVHVRYFDENLAARLNDTERGQLTGLLTKLNAPR